MYLYADANRIQRLLQTDDKIRFVCIRKYVEDFENVLYKMVECIKECGVDVEEIQKECAGIIAVGKQNENQNVCNMDAHIFSANILITQTADFTNAQTGRIHDSDHGLLFQIRHRGNERPDLFFRRNGRKIVKISFDISGIRFNSMVGKTTKGDRFPKRRKIFVHNGTS